MISIDASGLNCPMPLLKAKQALNKLDTGMQLTVFATDPGSRRDFQLFAEQSGHKLLRAEEIDGRFEFLFEKSALAEF